MNRTLAYRVLSRNQEEVKDVVGKFGDGKSDASFMTHKTNKTSGKAFDKHCAASDKKISGTNQKSTSRTRTKDWHLNLAYLDDKTQLKDLINKQKAMEAQVVTKDAICFVEAVGPKERPDTQKWECLGSQESKDHHQFPHFKILNAFSLCCLPKQKQEIQPYSISVIGVKRRRELIEKELSGPFEVVQIEESEEIFAKQPKRPATENQAMLMMSHTDADAIQVLKLIERSELLNWHSVALQKVCSMFSQDSVLEFLRNGEHHVFWRWFPLYLRMGQLQTQQQVGLLFAYLVFDGQIGATLLHDLQKLHKVTERQPYTYLQFLATKVYDKDTAK